MKTEILEELSKGRWGSKLPRLVLNRVIKFVTACLIFTLLFWLVLLEDYTSLFFLLGAISGFLIFMALRFLQNSFGKERLREGAEVNSEPIKLHNLEQVGKNPAGKN